MDGGPGRPPEFLELYEYSDKQVWLGAEQQEQPASHLHTLSSALFARVMCHTHRGA